MNSNTTRNSALGILSILGILAFSGCSQKPSSEEIAAQVKAAMAEEKAKEAAQAATAAAPAAVPVAAPAKTAAKPKPVAHAQPAPAEPAPVHKITCGNCGIVISLQEIELAGKGSGLGVIAGGVAGGLLGNQVGQGSGKDLATVAGVLGGAIAGNAIEKNIKKVKVYDVTVKMENGDERVLRHEIAPGVVAGDKVKVENEHVVIQ